MAREMSQEYPISGFRMTRKCITIRAMEQVRERGATAVEYGLFVALIAAVIIVGVAALGQSTIGLFQPASDFFASLPR